MGAPITSRSLWAELSRVFNLAGRPVKKFTLTCDHDKAAEVTITELVGDEVLKNFEEVTTTYSLTKREG